MEYNELLNKLQNNLQNITVNNQTIFNQNSENNVSNVLNKIGLEVQRQGGY